MSIIYQKKKIHPSILQKFKSFICFCENTLRNPLMVICQNKTIR